LPFWFNAIAHQLSVVPAWLGLKATALAWLLGALAFSKPRPGQSQDSWLGLGLAQPRPWLVHEKHVSYSLNNETISHATLIQNMTISFSWSKELGLGTVPYTVYSYIYTWSYGLWVYCNPYYKMLSDFLNGTGWVHIQPFYGYIQP
jgi:hypothetical protein